MADSAHPVSFLLCLSASDKSLRANIVLKIHQRENVNSVSYGDHFVLLGAKINKLPSLTSRTLHPNPPPFPGEKKEISTVKKSWLHPK